MFFTINTRKLIAQKIRGIWNPELYHGWGKEKRFFEGWYYKIVSKDEKNAFAFIPGVAMDEIGNKQAFIQILDGKNSTSEYIKFPFESFKASPNKHIIEIDKKNLLNTVSLGINKIGNYLNLLKPNIFILFIGYINYIFSTRYDYNISNFRYIGLY